MKRYARGPYLYAMAPDNDGAWVRWEDAIAQRDRLAALLREARGHTCDHLHHAKKDAHGIGDPCPVLARIDAALAKLDET